MSEISPSAYALVLLGDSSLEVEEPIPAELLVAHKYVRACLSSSCLAKYHRGCLNEHTLISHSSGGWKSQDQGVGMVGFW